MSDHITYTRDTLQRLSDRKNRKLAIDVPFDPPVVEESDPWIVCDSQVDVIDASESPLKEHRDLFGEIIQYESPALNNTTNTSTPKSRKRKQKKWEEVVEESPISRPKRAFIPTPRIVKLMKEAQMELYSVMGHSKSINDTSIVSEDSLNVSGVQNLIDSPEVFKNKPKNSEKTQSPPILEGVVAFVDYKIDNDRSGIGVKHRLTELGAKIEKTFNQKVTHVVFRDGYPSTYRKAIERNIPLVSARWVEGCKISNTLLNPVNYPPVDLEKYQKKPEIDYTLPKYNKYKKFLRPSFAQRDEILKTKCTNLMNQINALMDPLDENGEKSYTETPKKQNKKEPEDPFKTNDIISVISDQLSKVLNTNDSPIADEKIDELYVPMSIKLLRKYLTPKGSENKTPAALDSDLVKIEDRLNLNSRARYRLRKLLFPDIDLNNVSNVSDFPTPSPQKNRISAPAKLITIKKKQKNILAEKMNCNNNIEKIVPETFVEKQITKIPDNNVEKIGTPDNKLLKHIKHWKIPSDLRPKKVKTISKPVENNKQTKLTSWLSRDSSVFFQTPEESLASSIAIQTIVCTGMKKSEADIIQQSVDNLGTFSFQTKVHASTTYVVTKSQPSRTLNLVYAMAFGCYIVSEEWVHDSHKQGRWLSHLKYLITNLSEPVKAFQRQKNTFGSLLTFQIFDTAGSIYISDSCEPPAKDLKRLVRACGGNITSNVNLAEVVIGNYPKTQFNVNEKWILDCITQGKLLEKTIYKII